MSDAMVKLRAAATVIVARPTPENEKAPFEVFMVRRSSKVDFMPDMYVFPGGGLDAADCSSAMLERIFGLAVPNAAQSLRDIPDLGAWQHRLDLSAAQQAGLFVAALRELFEEAGVLLAVDTHNQPLDISTSPDLRLKFSTYRAQLLKGELSFLNLLEQANLKADLSRLTYFSHWITPISEKRRYDTYFFLATAPANQQASADLFETTEGIWIDPATALERYAAGTFGLVFPTIQHLKRMAAQASLVALQGYATTKPIISAMPDTFYNEAGQPYFILQPQVLEGW
jgi:8-oxo-dGTP pyrophosphatase MutT (NUDIX family)